uniref:Uncharacterized protein n=1 Tax=Vespula pensylvanica TaxID=30213 RepID=A0A834UD57_VESPE|nr:hypothetical protein H0235_005094 [Vespula pensylvanica]
MDLTDIDIGAFAIGQHHWYQSIFDTNEQRVERNTITIGGSILSKSCATWISFHSLAKRKGKNERRRDKLPSSPPSPPPIVETLRAANTKVETNERANSTANTRRV